MDSNTRSAAVRDDVDEDDEEKTSSAKYLFYQLGGEIQGVAVACVTEIIEMQKLTPVPGMPSSICGVINLRGRVVPVMDLRARFGMPAREYDDRTCTVIVRLGAVALGLVVDTVADVHEVPSADIEPALAMGKTGSKGSYVSGLAKVADKVVVLIDPQRLLEEAEMEAIDRAAAKPGGN